MTSPRWLWITAEVSGEMSTGRLVYSTRLVEALADHDVDVTVVGLGAAAAAADLHGSIDWQLVDEPLRGGWRSLLSVLPNLSFACGVAAMRARVAELLTEEWDVVVVDHLQAAWAVDALEECGARVVFVTHNHEASVRRAVARDAPLRNGRRLVLSFDARKAARLERKMVRRADLVTAITDDDGRKFSALDPDTPVIVIPPGWIGSHREAPPIAVRPRRIGMLGSLDWHVKQQNLRDFLAGADAALHAAGVEFVIAGSVPDDFRDEMAHAYETPRFLGHVDDVAAFLHSCRLGVIAEPLGGGFKLKSLDYVFHHVPIAAVRGSVTGLPLDARSNMVEADGHAELGDAIVQAIDDVARLAAIADSAAAACVDTFSWHRGADRLLEAVAR